MTGTIQILNPVARFRQASTVDAFLPDTLNGKVIGVLNNNKPNARLFFETVLEILGKRFDLGGHFIVSKSAPPIPAPIALIDELVAKADVVFTGSGD